MKMWELKEGILCWGCVVVMVYCVDGILSLRCTVLAVCCVVCVLSRQYLGMAISSRDHVRYSNGNI